MLFRSRIAIDGDIGYVAKDYVNLRVKYKRPVSITKILADEKKQQEAEKASSSTNSTAKNEVKEDDAVLVTLYVDKSDRLCASMKVYNHLSNESPYKKDDEVFGRVYEISDNFGVFIAVDDKYSALLPKKEVFEKYRINQPVYARVAQVMEDGRLTLSVKKKIPEQMNDDASFIYETLQRENGFLPFNDKSDSEAVKNRFHMSKNAFKRAIGHLYKERLITIEKDGIHLN